MPNEIPDAPSELDAVLEQLVFRLYRGMRREPGLLDLSPQDPVLLKQIFRNPGIGVAELAELELLRKPTITSHINRLEKAGMVRRVASKSDGRRIGLHITPKGRKAIDLTIETRLAFIDRRLSLLAEPERALLEAAIPAMIKVAG